jgi:hypothetical protein
MQNAESILVVILASVLIIFLIVGIVLLAMVAKLVQAMRRVVQRAEHVVESAGDAADLLKNASGPLALFKLVRNIMKAVDKARK